MGICFPILFPISPSACVQIARRAMRPTVLRQRPVVSGSHRAPSEICGVFGTRDWRKTMKRPGVRFQKHDVHLRRQTLFHIILQNNPQVTVGCRVRLSPQRTHKSGRSAPVGRPCGAMPRAAGPRGHRRANYPGSSSGDLAAITPLFHWCIRAKPAQGL